MFNKFKPKIKLPKEVQSILEDYYSERLNVINPSMDRNEPGTEFYELVKIEKEFLEGINEPKLIKLKLQYVLHDRLQSINKVKHNIADVKATQDERNEYIISNYEKDLKLLRLQVHQLQNALQQIA